MSASLNNVETAAGYTAAATLTCPDTQTVDLIVANAAIYYQVGRGSPPAWDEPETFLIPTIAGVDVVADALRFRSAVASVPARVTAKAYAAGEIPNG